MGFIPEDLEHGLLSLLQLVVLPGHDPEVFALTAVDIRSRCVQGCSQITSRLSPTTLDEKTGWYVKTDRVVTLAADHCSPQHKEYDVEHAFWHVCCSQESFSAFLFPVAYHRSALAERKGSKYLPSER